MLSAIPIEPGYRVAVSYDLDAWECPAAFYGSSAVVYDCGGVWRPHGRGYCHNGDDAGAIADAVAYYGDDSPESIAAALARHYARAGWDCLSRRVCPGNPYDAYTEFVAVAPGYGKAGTLAREVGQWRNGEVYALELQALRDGEWATLDALCSVYGDDLEETARDMALCVAGGASCAA